MDCCPQLQIWLSLFVTFAVAAVPLQGAYAASGNLGIYTSPIDATGLRIELQASAPDRNTGAPVTVPLPVGLLGPKMNSLVSTPISTQVDQFWAVIPDSNTRMTQRDRACNGPNGIVQEVQKAVSQIGSGYGAYDVSCNLASTGKLLVKQVGSTLYFAYLLTNNKVSFKVATPYTCHARHGTLACPDDPFFQVTFASEIQTVIRTPDVCHLTAEGGTVTTQAATIDGSSSLTGALAQMADDLLLGHKFQRAERAIEAAEQQAPLPLDSAFKELRDGDACTGRNSAIRRALAPFRELDTIIQPPRAIVLQIRHVGITAPTLSGPDPWGSKAQNQPTFTRPMIATNQPIVPAGSSIQIRGQYFPANPNLANQIPITLSHGGYGNNSIVLGGVCSGGYTEIQWNQNPAVQLPGDAQGACVRSYQATNLAPATPYQFRARDCDAITCSPWSSPARVTTAAGGADKEVALTIDGGGTSNTPWNRPVSTSPVGASTAAAASNSPWRRASPNSAITAQAAASTNTNAWNRPVSNSAVHSSGLVGDTSLGSAALTPQGTFMATVTIPPGMSAGTHTIRAVSGEVKAEVAINVTAVNSNGARASLMVVGLLNGETGCPNHPINSTATDANFMLFGAGFSGGGVAIYLDKTSARPLGTLTVRPDGTFCQLMPGVPSGLAGPHMLLAVQNGSVLTQTPVTFVARSVVR